jgi:hypothetical protein
VAAGDARDEMETSEAKDKRKRGEKKGRKKGIPSNKKAIAKTFVCFNHEGGRPSEN